MLKDIQGKKLIIESETGEILEFELEKGMFAFPAFNVMEQKIVGLLILPDKESASFDEQKQAWAISKQGQIITKWISDQLNNYEEVKEQIATVNRLIKMFATLHDADINVIDLDKFFGVSITGCINCDKLDTCEDFGKVHKEVCTEAEDILREADQSDDED